MTEQRSDTPTSDALSEAQDAMVDAIVSSDGTDAGRMGIVEAWRAYNAAQANAQVASQASLANFLEQLLIDVEGRISDRITSLSNERRREMLNLTIKIEEQHKDTVDRIHAINNHMQMFVETQYEQAQFATQLEGRIDQHEERLDRTEDRLAVVMTRLNQIGRELQQIREYIGMPEPAELDVLILPSAHEATP